MLIHHYLKLKNLYYAIMQKKINQSLA
jgi:hypothetical protein